MLRVLVSLRNSSSLQNDACRRISRRALGCAPLQNRTLDSLRRFRILPVSARCGLRWNGRRSMATTSVAQAARSVTTESPVDTVSVAVTPVVASTAAAAATPLPVLSWSLIYHPINLASVILLTAHSLGQPWWITLIGTTVAIRLCMFPLMVSQIRNSTTLANIAPQTKAISEKMKVKGTPAERAAAQRSMGELLSLYKQHNCSPWKSLIPILVNGFIFMVLLFSVQELAGNSLSGFATGGPSWLPDLSKGLTLDLESPHFWPHVILIASTSLTMMATIAVGADGMAQQMQPGMYRFMMLMACLMGPLTYKFPAACFVYWNANNLISLLQTTVLKNPAVKRWLNIPQIIKHPDFKPSSPFSEVFRSPPPPPPPKVYSARPRYSKALRTVAVRKEKTSSTGTPSPFEQTK